MLQQMYRVIFGTAVAIVCLNSWKRVYLVSILLHTTLHVYLLVVHG